jgi:hypothetical protein
MTHKQVYLVDRDDLNTWLRERQLVAMRNAFLDTKMSDVLGWIFLEGATDWRASGGSTGEFGSGTEHTDRDRIDFGKGFPDCSL